MKFSSTIPFAFLVFNVFALPGALDTRAAPTIYTAGDSTMAAKGANNGVTDGKNFRHIERPDR